MNVDGQLSCGRCGARRHSEAGVCPACGYDQATDVGELTADASDYLSAEISSEPHNPVKDWISRRQSQAGMAGWLARAVAGESRAALILHPVAWVILPTLAALIFGSQAHRAYQQWPAFAVALALIPACAIYWNRRAALAALRSFWLPSPHLHWGWVMVGLAVFLRLALHGLLPLDRPIFEEIETGKNAYDLVALGYDLQLEFRFTNIMGALGFLFGDFDLQSLRLFFQLSGALSVLVMALTLRRMRVSWPVTLLVVFTMASLRYLVVSNGTAHEILASTLFEMLLLYCLVGNFTSENRKMTWAALAGLFAGILMYEHISYKPVILIAPVWWLWQAVNSKDTAARTAALLSGAAFVGCLSLVALPTIYDIASGPADSRNLSGLFTNVRDANFGISSEEPFALVPYLKGIAYEAFQYCKLIFGWRDAWSDSIHKMPGNTVVLPLAGALFLVGFCYTTLRPAFGGLTVIAALAIVATIMTLTILSSYFNPSRIIGAFPLLLIMAALALESLYRTLSSTRLSLPGNPAIWIGLLGIAITLGNVQSVKAMSSHPGTIATYDQGKYNVCRIIPKEDREYRQVLVHADGAVCRPDHERWLFPEIPTERMAQVAQLPAPDQVPAGTLVITGTADPGGINGAEIENFLHLATSLASVHTLQVATNTLGNVSAMTFCYRCDDDFSSLVPQAVNNDPPSSATAPVSTGVSIVPNPTNLDLRATPNEHHPVHLVTAASAVIIPSPAHSVVIHNDPDLQGQDGCKGARRAPEGDTRMLIILPDPGVETRSPFYLVGCAPGEATLVIESEGEILKTYHLTVAVP